jgi:hypothetical protein
MVVVVHRGGIAGHRDTRFKQRALVGLILDRNSRWNRLQALKPGGRLEIRALFAAMQGGAALGTLAFPVHARGQSSRTVETASRDNVLQKPGKAGSGDIDGRTWTVGFRPVASERAVAGLAAVVHVSALFVFAVVVHVSNRLLEFVLSHHRLVAMAARGS